MRFNFVEKLFCKKKVFLTTLLSLGIIFAVFTPFARANIFDDIITGAKNLLSPAKKELTIDSDISLVPEGDVNKNGQIDAGDIVRFTYEIRNITDTAYSFATLNTNIDKKQLNFIHNVSGTTSLINDGKTIVIPNFRIGANQVAIIHFDARINYYTDKDVSVATETEFIDKDKKLVTKSLRKEIKAMRINKDKIPGSLFVIPAQAGIHKNNK